MDLGVTFIHGEVYNIAHRLNERKIWRVILNIQATWASKMYFYDDK